jgi:hypothetical protein
VPHQYRRAAPTETRATRQSTASQNTASQNTDQSFRVLSSERQQPLSVAVAVADYCSVVSYWRVAAVLHCFHSDYDRDLVITTATFLNIIAAVMTKNEKEFIVSVVKICERLYIQKEVLLRMMEQTRVKDWELHFDDFQDAPEFVEPAREFFSFAYECIRAGALDGKAAKRLAQGISAKKKPN